MKRKKRLDRLSGEGTGEKIDPLLFVKLVFGAEVHRTGGSRMKPVVLGTTVSSDLGGKPFNKGSDHISDPRERDFSKT